MSRKSQDDSPRVAAIEQPFPLPTIRSQRARDVAAYFEIEDRGETAGTCPVNRAALLQLLPPAGRATLITGASGSGKSSLLREIRGMRPVDLVIDLAGIPLPDVPIVDLFPQLTLRQTLQMLSQVGLTEAWTYLRIPSELSDGQRWRLRLVLGIEAIKTQDDLLICDEFAALLDRVTARIVAHRFAKLIAGKNVRAIIATSHDDLDLALRPAVKARCDFNIVEIEANHGQRLSSLPTQGTINRKES